VTEAGVQLDRTAEMFARAKSEGRTPIVIFTPCGFPERNATYDIVKAALDGGADAIEIGFPFSDPLGDGPANQKAYDLAIRNGFEPSDIWDVTRRLRSDGVRAPLLIMGYFNPIVAYGIEAFVRDAARAGVDGFIVVDLPPEEAGELERVAQAAGLHIVYLLAPTSTDERIRLVAEHASGFIYCVSVTGVTGARAALSDELPGWTARVRAQTDLPLAIGFGISKPEHVREVGRWADAAVVGSALVNVIAEAGTSADLTTRVEEYVRWLKS
jgi:tryptophan synthase alpha subunit